MDDEIGPIRWNGLFADLEAQASELDRTQRAGEIDERARAEVGRLRLIDRLGPAIGVPLRVSCVGELTLRGRLSGLGADWLLLAEDAGGEALVALSAVSSIAGLGRLSAAPGSEGPVASRLGLRSVLRGVVRDRSFVRVHLRHGAAVDGTADRVGADFIELASHPAGELRRRGEVRDVLLLPLANVSAVRRA